MRQILMRLLIALITCNLFLTTIGCSTNPPPEHIEPIIVSGITRILEHEPGNYTFYVQSAESPKVGKVYVRVHAKNVTTLVDVPDEQSSFIELVSCCVPGGCYQCKTIPQGFSHWYVKPRELVLHLHSTKEINGAGWNHGKHGSGMTTELE